MDKMRFFDDKDVMEEVALTEEEYKFFDELEYSLYRHSGKKYISGGYCHIKIYEVDEDECSCEGDCDCPDGVEEYIYFYDTYGTEGESWEQGDSHKYGRNSKKVVY